MISKLVIDPLTQILPSLLFYFNYLFLMPDHFTCRGKSFASTNIAKPYVLCDMVLLAAKYTMYKNLDAMVVKEIVQGLVDDNMVDTERIGTSNYFWAFPSKAMNMVNFKELVNLLVKSHMVL